MNRYTIKQIADLCETTPEIIITHLRENFGEVLPDVHNLQSTSEVDYDTANATLDYFGAVIQEFELVPEAKIEETEAIQVAATRFTQTLVMNMGSVTGLLVEQNKTLGNNVGAQAAIAFTQSYVAGYSQVMNPVINFISAQTDIALEQVDRDLMKLTQEGQDGLGEAVRQQSRITQKIASLKARNRSLTAKIQNG